METLEQGEGTAGPPVPLRVISYCRGKGLGDIARCVPLHGGMISLTQRLITSSGRSLVLKQADDAPPRLFEIEAEGLQALSTLQAPRTPRVLSAAGQFLLLEDLGTLCPGEGYWEEFGRALALQHTTHTNARFGYGHDNYLGRLPQRNGWMDDGYVFFAERRLLRYLSEPLVEQTLTVQDRKRLEQVVARLPELIPPQPASLLHGDLWWANMLVGPRGEPAMVDPAVYFGWPEAELSMTWHCGRVPDVFFSAYAEIYPLLPGWRERFEILHLREILSMLAHFGDQYGSLARLRDVIRKFT